MLNFIHSIARFFRKPKVLLILIILLGLLLRFNGLYHGIHFHPDERSNIMHVEKLSFDDLNPHFFAYGSLPLYLLFLIKQFLSLFTQALATYDGLFKIGRVLSALTGLFTILTTYLIGLRMYNRRSALLSSFFLAVAVLHIQYSHFYAVDILMTFAVSLVFLALLGIVRKGAVANYLLTGLFFGIGLATKISIAPLVLAVFLGHLLGLGKRGRLWNVRGQALLLWFLLAGLVAFSICQPYTFLDLEKFVHDVSEQGRMVTGKWQPPYTIQYEKTTIFLYPLTQMMQWSLGYPITIAALIGFALALRSVFRRWISLELLLLLWIIPYFLINGSFQVKFLRYMLPIFPFLCLLAARFFDTLLNNRTNRVSRIVGRLSLAVTILYCLGYSLSFSMIYMRPHPYYSASRWIYETIPAQDTILLEHWDDGLPVSIPGERSKPKPKTITLALYHKDTPAKAEKLADSLQQGSYVVCATKRLYGSICKVPERYPITARYYQLLLSGKLGYRLEKSFQSYPSLFGYEIVDDLADESFSVYDHPKVLIFKKYSHFSSEEILRLLNTPLPPGEQIAYEEIVLARTFGDQIYHPFDTDQSLVATLKFLIFIEIISFLALPFCMFLCRSNFVVAYALAKVLGVLFLSYLVWIMIQVGIAVFDQSGILLCLVLFGFGAYLSAGKAFRWGTTAQDRKSIWFWEALFLSVFFLFLIIRAFNPEIHWGEKPMDFSFLNSCYRTTQFPIEDPWFSGKNVNYYYFGYFQAAMLGKILGIAPGLIFNLVLALIPAFVVVMVTALLLFFHRNRVYALCGAGIVTLGSNLSAFYQLLFEGKKVGFGMWWDTSRILPSPAIDEYPIWSFLFADLHGHVLALPVALVGILFTIMLIKALRKGRRFDILLYSICVSFFLSILSITNAWDFVPYSGLILFGLISGLGLFSEKSHPTLHLKGRGRLFLHLVLRLLLSIGIILLSFGWTLFYHFNYQGKGVNFGFVDSGFASLKELFLHFGQFLVIIIIAAGSGVWCWLANKVGSGEGLDNVQKLFHSKMRRDLFIGVLCFIVLGIITFLPRQALVLGILLFLGSTLYLLSGRGPFVSRTAALFIALTGGVIAGAEIFFVIDRMNTIFKFYYPVWLFLGLGSVLLLPSFFGWRENVRTSVEECAAPVEIQPVPKPSSLDKQSILVYSILFAVFAAQLVGTFVGIITVVSLQRVPELRPTLDGRKYMLLTSPEDYVASRWLNRNVHGRPVLAESHGPSYQAFSRISMHTGLPTIIGWEHHVFQRGAERTEIADRKKDVRLLYTSARESTVKRIIDTYGISLIYLGELERRTYLKNDQNYLATYSDILRPLFHYENTIIYQVIQEGVPVLTSAAVSMPQGATFPLPGSEQKLVDWELNTLFEVPPAYAQRAHLYGVALDKQGNIFVADAGNNFIYQLDARGRLKTIINPTTLVPPLNYPTFLVVDEQNGLWVSDTGNNRVVGLQLEPGSGPESYTLLDKGLQQPAGLVLDSQNALVIADHGHHRVVRAAPPDYSISEIITHVEKPFSLFFRTTDELAVYSLSKGMLSLVSLQDGTVSTFSACVGRGFLEPEGFVSGLGQDGLYFADASTGEIRWYTLQGELARSIFPTKITPQGIAALSNSCFILSDGNQNKVLKLCRQKSYSMFHGGHGSLPGQFSEPRAIAQDSRGYFYVADTKNHRIQKFDNDGNYILQWGAQGDRPGQFNEPMGIAISSDDFIFIADTWNQRIQKFDSKGKLISQWEDFFYGPRDIYVHNDRVYVTDTGNAVIKVYDPSGRKIRTVGKRGNEPGEFHEPIGIAVAHNKIYICDSKNRRVQILDVNGNPLSQIYISSWLEGSISEPYLTLLPNDRFAISSAAESSILIYNHEGKMIKTITTINGQPLNKPRGLVFSRSDGQLYIVDTWKHCIRRQTLGEPKSPDE